MMNGQVKTVAELEGHLDPPFSEKEGDSKDAKCGIKGQSSMQQKGYSNPDSGDQSAYYRLIGMMRANGSFDDMPVSLHRKVSVLSKFSKMKDYERFRVNVSVFHPHHFLYEHEHVSFFSLEYQIPWFWQQYSL